MIAFPMTEPAPAYGFCSKKVWSTRRSVRVRCHDTYSEASISGRSSASEVSELLAVRRRALNLESFPEAPEKSKVSAAITTL
jgi:hypothetical protein